jgi:hypothetical protein
MRAQVWIEAVLYTIIGLALIGVVLAVVTPKINQERERRMVMQTIGSLNEFDGVMTELRDLNEGNRRKIPEFKIDTGSMYIDGESDKIIFEIDELENPYSEVGSTVHEGNVEITTNSTNKEYAVYLVLDYSSNTNLTFELKDQVKKFNAASLPYSFLIENKGVSGGKILLDIWESV